MSTDTGDLMPLDLASAEASSRRSSRSAPRSRATAATSCSTSVDADGVVHVSLVGACGTCPVSMMTLKAGVERIIMDRVPGVTEVVADESERVERLRRGARPSVAALVDARRPG